MTTARDKIAEIIRETVFGPWFSEVSGEYDAAVQILAALPDMIEPLVWDGFFSGPYKIHVHEGGIADLWFCGKALDSDEEHELLMGGYLTLVSIDDLKHEANANHRRQFLAAFKEPSK